MANIPADVIRVWKDTQAEYTGNALKNKQWGACRNTDKPSVGTQLVMRNPDGDYEFFNLGGGGIADVNSIAEVQSAVDGGATVFKPSDKGCALVGGTVTLKENKTYVFLPTPTQAPSQDYGWLISGTTFNVENSGTTALRWMGSVYVDISGSTLTGVGLSVDTIEDAGGGTITTDSVLEVGILRQGVNISSTSDVYYEEGDESQITASNIYNQFWKTPIPKTVDSSESNIIPITNGTGSTLSIGRVVTPDGATGAKLASAHNTEDVKLLAVMKNSIANGGSGELTKFGPVEGTVSDPFDTSAFNTGDFVYLSDVLPATGNITDVQVGDGSYDCIIGVIEVSDPVVGRLFVDINVTELTVEVTDTNGYSPTEKNQTTMSVVEGTRTFTITPTDPQFHIYELGRKYELAGAQSVVWSDIEGEHWFWIQNGALTHKFNPTLNERIDVILKYAFTAVIYWDAVNKKIVGDILEERHGISMSPETHIYSHLTRGAQYVTGYSLGDINSDASTNTPTDVQYSVSFGWFKDEDINHIEDGKAVGDPSPIIWTESGNLVRDYHPTFTIDEGYGLVLGAGGNPCYNDPATGLVEVTNNNFFLMHVFGYNGQDEQTLKVVGQNQYATKALARAGATSEISNLVFGLDRPETIPVATIIYEVKSSYGGIYNARIVSDGDGNDYVSWTTTELAQGNSPTSHSNLTNVDPAAPGTTQGHINDQAQTIGGEKTFADSATFSSGATTSQTAEENLSSVSNLSSVKANAVVNGASPYSYGATGDGVADDTTALVNCLTDNDVINLSGGVFACKDITVPREGMTIRGGSLKTFGTPTTGLLMLAGETVIEDVDFVGTGKASGITTDIGVQYSGDGSFVGTGKSIISNCRFTGFGADAIYTTNLVDTYQGAFKVDNCYLEDSNKGINFDTRGEYSSLSNCHINGCNTGLRIKGGNNSINDCVITNNVTGVDFQDGANAAHGAFGGNQINHNNTNIVATNSIIQNISNCELYAGDIQINGTGHFSFEGGTISSGAITLASGSKGIFNGTNLRDVGTGVTIIDNSSGGWKFLDCWDEINSEFYLNNRVEGTSGIVYANGWGDFGGGYSVKLFKNVRTGRVTMRGLISGGTTTSGIEAMTLPVGFRPVDTVHFDKGSNSAWRSGTGNITVIDISDTGLVTLVDADASYTSLQSISFDTI